MFSQEGFASTIPDLPQYKATCQGCNTQCSLTIAYDNGCWHPVIGGVIIRHYYDTNRKRQLILSTTCNSERAALDFAKKLVLTCDNFGNHR